MFFRLIGHFLAIFQKKIFLKKLYFGILKKKKIFLIGKVLIRSKKKIFFFFFSESPKGPLSFPIGYMTYYILTILSYKPIKIYFDPQKIDFLTKKRPFFSNFWKWLLNNSANRIPFKLKFWAFVEDL